MNYSRPTGWGPSFPDEAAHRARPAPGRPWHHHLPGVDLTRMVRVELVHAILQPAPTIGDYTGRECLAPDLSTWPGVVEGYMAVTRPLWIGRWS